MNLVGLQFLKPFRETDFFLLEKWVKDADLLFQFAGSNFTFPLTYKQLSSYGQQFPDRQFYLGYTPEGRAFAFGEIIPQENNTPRIGRLLIGEESDRGKGLGKYFIRLLMEECQRRFKTKAVDLYVIEGNEKAIHCYESLGFQMTDDTPLMLHHSGKNYRVLKMELKDLNSK